MGTYGLDEVIRRWEQAALTVEQAIGQILLLLQATEESADQGLSDDDVLIKLVKPVFVKEEGVKRLEHAADSLG